VSNEREIDAATGVETTGHEWDGIKELNRPLPKWWVYTFYATILWSFGYWLAYPAFPTLNDYTRGLLGYSQRATVAQEVKAAKAAQAGMRETLAKIALADVRKDPEVLRFAIAGGNAAFQSNCAPCHGRGAQGFSGYPNLNDDDWIWGGSIEEIHQTILHGVRSEDKQTRISQMPRYGLDGLFTSEQIADVAEHVLSFSGRAQDQAAAQRGAVIFKEQCVACHGDDGKGKVELGAPNLTDGIWLYGGSKQAIAESIRTGRGGVMPRWQDRLDHVTVKALAVYVHSLGGGQ
jgi:cytochrome c oxidase cbb3-type subunit 3